MFQLGFNLSAPLSRRKEKKAPQAKALAWVSKMLADWTRHPGCGCKRPVVAAAAVPAAGDAGLPMLNWVGPSTEPQRLALSETAGMMADAMLIGSDNYHFLLDSSRGVGAQLEAAGLTVHYTEDTAALTAESLARTKVLVILKDGGWPPEAGSQWMKPEQEAAIEEWVLSGGGLMPLHNSLWAIPGWKEELSGALINSNGLTAYSDVPLDEDVAESLSQDPAKMHPFRRTAGGVGGYHPSFERQWVKVIDDSHSVTKNISDYEIGPCPPGVQVHSSLSDGWWILPRARRLQVMSSILCSTIASAV